MRHVFRNLSRTISNVFADRLLQLLLLGVIAATFVFAFVLGADASIVVGVLVIGVVTAFAESSSHRNRK
jgi:hypothetical protein